MERSAFWSPEKRLEVARILEGIGDALLEDSDPPNLLSHLQLPPLPPELWN